MTRTAVPGGTAAVVRARRPRRLGATGTVALVALLLVVVMAVLAPVIAPDDPTRGDLLAPYAPIGPEHWLGTDSTGRDVASRLIHGARTSLLGPAAIVALAFLVSLPLALVAAWRGGIVETLVTRAFDVVFSVPGLLLAILAVSLFGAGLPAAVVALAIAYVPYVGRIALTAAQRERRLPYVQALTVQGQAVVPIMVRHVLRNTAPLLVGQGAVAFAYALIDLASLSFLGLAVQAPQADWGVLVSDRDSLLRGQPLQVVVAGTLIVAVVLSLFVLGARLSGERPSLRSWAGRRRAR